MQQRKRDEAGEDEVGVVPGAEATEAGDGNLCLFETGVRVESIRFLLGCPCLSLPASNA